MKGPPQSCLKEIYAGMELLFFCSVRGLEKYVWLSCVGDKWISGV